MARTKQLGGNRKVSHWAALTCQSSTHLRCMLALSLCLIGTGGRSARAECPPEWLYGPGQGLAGVDGAVAASTTWDPDGPGGQPELLVVGGWFEFAGDATAKRIAAWDGVRWLPLSAGMNDIVTALTVYNGELIAGGSFTTAGDVKCNHIARWDGARWRSLGSGMGESDPYVFALTVYNGELIAGGAFHAAGGKACNYVARWDGEHWQALGSGMNFWVYALAVYNGELVMGGAFTTAGGKLSAFWARWGCPFAKGDLNCDGKIDSFDIDPFVLALVRPDEYNQRFPNCERRLADVNRDDWVNNFDIDAFVKLLTP